jgi:hypothetical protein
MKVLFLVVTLFAPATFAATVEVKSDCVDARQMKVEGKDQKFCWSERLDAWVTPSCVMDKNNSCGAIQLLETAKKYPEKLSSDELHGGKNPGSVLCAKIGGEVMFAVLKSGSQASFCQAADKSMIDCNALSISK